MFSTKTYKYFDAPLEVHGVPFWNENHKLERIKDEDMVDFPRLSHLGKRVPGARICFRTDATEFNVKFTFKTLTFDIGMSIYACQSANVMIGEHKNARFAGIVYPKNHETKTAERTFKKSAEIEDVTVFLPRNEIIEDFEITVPDDAAVLAPTPYFAGTILFYGSSITEGGCVARFTNSYNALISSWLDADYYNFGFSGSARGELKMADIINSIPIDVLVMDYDHNSPTAEELLKTHEPFFNRIREKHPTLPVVMVSAPVYKQNQNNDRRAKIIRTTYENAVAKGDKNVWFVDGRKFFGDLGEYCSVDNIHPNDLGMHLMAKAIMPAVKEALEKVSK